MTHAEAMKLAKKHAKRVGKQLDELDKVLREKVAGNMAAVLPPAERPLAKIEHCETEGDNQLEKLRAAIKGRPDRVITAGKYAVLFTRPKKQDGSLDMENWCLMMSDTPYEMRAARYFQARAHGHVLILGLGLGATTIPIMQKPEVTKVTVVEVNHDVIKLVSPWIRPLSGGAKLDIHLDNAFTWNPPKGMKFNAIWVDIWSSISLDNMPDITRLKRRYSRWLDRKNDPEAHLEVWEEWHLRREAKQEREDEKMRQAILGAIGGDARRRL